MLTFLIINDFNDINNAVIRHFSLDKGHFLAKSFSKFGHRVDFYTTINSYHHDGIYYINVNEITESYLDNVDYVLIVREPLFVDIMKTLPAVAAKLAIHKTQRLRPKFIVKSDSPIWFRNKKFTAQIRSLFDAGTSEPSAHAWIINHVDYICAQNQEFAATAYAVKVPRSSILISNMSVANKYTDLSTLENPYSTDHSYCVNNALQLNAHKALIPLYYLEHPEMIHEFNTEKHILVYTGRIKSDGGKIFYNMKNIMDLLGNEYELHIFPGSFLAPDENGQVINHSGKNRNSLELLRNTIFATSTNVIIHHPYEHEDKYRYLYYASCGIDFSDLRPKRGKPLAGHAKILEYCESGLPVVCEENIHNLFLVRNGKNAIVLPYMASDQQYAEAITRIVNMTIDRQYCRLVTIRNENWDKRAIELLRQLRDHK